MLQSEMSARDPYFVLRLRNDTPVRGGGVPATTRPTPDSGQQWATTDPLTVFDGLHQFARNIDKPIHAVSAVR